LINKLHIETDRLIVRAYEKSDLQEAYELMQERDLFTYLPMEIMTYADYQELFAWLIQCYDMSCNNAWFKYSFLIARKEDGVHLGWCGIGSLDYNHSDIEVFFLIGKPYWGRGYASEAVQALIRYSFDNMKLPRLVAVVKPENMASKRVIEKLGFRCEGTVEGLPEEFNFYNGELYYALDNND